MAKIAQRYVSVDPFKIIEEGFHPERSKVSESLFSLANEYCGIRGTFDEGTHFETLRGSYFNGVYDYAKEDTPIHYKGIIQRTHFMINSVDWIKVIIKSTITPSSGRQNQGFHRELDMTSGLLFGSLILKPNSASFISSSPASFDGGLPPSLPNHRNHRGSRNDRGD
jgi:maltose phosphorylase